MNLDQICINARTRTPWEAIDLGIMLTRAWWWPLYISWLTPALCIFTLLYLIAPQHSWLAYATVWWLKPLLDRGPLFIASRRLFGEKMSAKNCLKRLPGLYRRDLFSCLTIRRLSLTRSFDMPLTSLEELKSDKRRLRLNALHLRFGGTASWLTIIALHIEAFLILGISSFLIIMIPENIELNYWQWFIDEQAATTWVYNTCAFFTMTLVGPFYSVCGFALYISRRIDLEAWDIEIRFRHIANEYQKKNRKISVGNKINCLLISCLLFTAAAAPSLPTIAEADLTEPAKEKSAESISAKKTILSVLEGDAFHQRENVSGWRFKDIDKKENEEIPEWLIQLIEFFFKHLWSPSDIDDPTKQPIAYIEHLLWIGLICIVMFAMYKYRQFIREILFLKNTGEHAQNIPETLFGLDVRKETLPSDVPKSVRELWESNKHREAFSLLYRSTLAALIHHHDFVFYDNNTEGECVSIVKERSNKPLTAYVESLTLHWQRLAYGHIIPNRKDIEILCGQWQELFPDA